MRRIYDDIELIWNLDLNETQNTLFTALDVRLDAHQRYNTECLRDIRIVIFEENYNWADG